MSFFAYRPETAGDKRRADPIPPLNPASTNPKRIRRTGIAATEQGVVDTSVAEFFGVSSDRVPALLTSFVDGMVTALQSPDSLRGQGVTLAAAAPAPVASLSTFVPNFSLASLYSTVDTTCLSFLFQLVERSSGGRVTCLDALHILAMPGNVYANDELCTAFAASLESRHLDRPVACSWTCDGHSGLLYANHDDRCIYILDPMGNPERYKKHAASLNRFLMEERRRLHRHVGMLYKVLGNPEDLALQGDSVSCGVMVYVYLYFITFHGRWPRRDEIRPANHFIYRSVMYESCIKGRVRSPLIHGSRYSVATLDADGFAIVQASMPTILPESQSACRAAVLKRVEAAAKKIPASWFQTLKQACDTVLTASSSQSRGELV